MTTAEAWSQTTARKLISALICLGHYLAQLRRAALDAAAEPAADADVRAGLRSDAAKAEARARRAVDSGLGGRLVEALRLTPPLTHAQWNYRMIDLIDRVGSLADLYANPDWNREDLAEHEAEYQAVTEALLEGHLQASKANAAVTAASRGVQEADPVTPPVPTARPWDRADLTAPQRKLVECLWDAAAGKPKAAWTPRKNVIAAVYGRSRRSDAGKALSALKKNACKTMDKARPRVPLTVDAHNKHGWRLREIPQPTSN